MLKKEINENIVNKVKEVYKENPDLNIVKDTVNDILDISLTKYNVKIILEGLLDDINVSKMELKEAKSLNDKIDDNVNYEIDGDDLVFYKKRKDIDGEGNVERISVPIELVGDLTYDYTYGKLSGPDIIKKYEIKPEVWSTLKKRLNIFKNSNALPDVVLDYIAEKYGEESVEDKIIEVSHRAVHDKYRNRFKKAYDNKKERDDDKIRKVFANTESFLEHVQSYLENYKPRDIDFIEKPLENNDETTILISDIHLGKKNSDAIRKRIDTITNDMINRKESIINIINLGDLVETLVEGGMHPGQIEHMDGPFGFDLIMEVVEMVENMLINIRKSGKAVNFYGIGGNHDRMSKGHGEDMARTGALVMYELIRRGLNKADISVKNFREKWNTVNLTDFNFIIHHGDDNMTSKNPTNILWEHGRQDKHNVLAFGDKHHSESIDISENATKLIVPALAGRGEYDTRLALSSNPGYVIIDRNSDGLPDTTIRRLK